MKMEFKRMAFGQPGWVLKDDKIIVNNKEYPLSELYDLENFISPNKHINPSIQFKFNGKIIYLFYSRDEEEVARAEKAYDYILKNSKDAEKYIEHRMKCSVCGNIFCYTGKDLDKNEEYLRLARRDSMMAVGNALAGTQYGTLTNSANSEKHLDKIIDFSKCPKCGSKDLVDISRNSNIDEDKNNIDVVSEIKKYKELLDMGAITQEEFDKKKRELL